MELCHLNHCGEHVYVRDNDEGYEWLPAVVLQADKDRVQVQVQLPHDWDDMTILPNNCKDSNKAIRWVDLNDYFNHTLPLRGDDNVSVRDLAEMRQLHEAAALYQIKGRHAHNKPYTRLGDIMVAINPCQWIPGLYSSAVQEAYARKLVWQVSLDDEGNNPSVVSEEKKDDRISPETITDTNRGLLYPCDEPHIYEVSALAYRNMAHSNQDQTILVSGESGAGKTETVKMVLEHLTSISKFRPDCDGLTMGQVDSLHLQRLSTQLLNGLPIFEAFGNAQTGRNPNSSRFAKISKLLFSVDQENHTCVLQGAKTETRLLEASRVFSRGSQDRNFHIFYQLLAAQPNVKEEILGSGWTNASSADFKYLSTGMSFVAREDGPGKSDASLWVETEGALRSFGWKASKQKMLFRALGIVLRLGNLTFEENDNNSASVSSRYELETLAGELEIPVGELESGLTFKTVSARSEDIQVPCSAAQAKDNCDVLAKTLYAMIFDVVVRRMNEQSIVPNGEDSYTSISLVDIFGFESFETNSFEQLCVNYTSEKLQHMYVNSSLRKCTQQYELEGIDVFDFRSLENTDILRLFEAKSGLIEMLNEECLLPNGSNQSFVFRIKSKCKGLLLHDLQGKMEFGVNHFAGPVMYDARNFVERNNDRLPTDLMLVVKSTSNVIIRSEIKSLLQSNENGYDRKKKKLVSVLDSFRLQLQALITDLKCNHTRYIRCIKPNEELLPRKLDHSRTLRQLRFSGLVAAVDLCRDSFPAKMDFLAVEERFGCLAPTSRSPQWLEMPVHDRVNLLMSMIFAPFVESCQNSAFSMPYACGTTDVYFRAGGLNLLEQLRSKFYVTRAVEIQKWLRKVRAWRKYKVVIGSAVCLQAHIRSHLASLSYVRLKRQVIVLQSLGRGIATREACSQRREALAVLQKWLKFCSVCYQKRSLAARVLQRWWRCLRVRDQWLVYQYNSVKVQTWYRGRRLVRRYTSLRASLVAIQACIRGLLSRDKWERSIQAIRKIQRWFRARRRDEQSSAFGAFDGAPYSSSSDDSGEARRVDLRSSKMNSSTWSSELERIPSDSSQDSGLQPTEQAHRYVQEIELLKDEVMQVTEEAEMHKQEIEAEFEDRLAEYEDEVLALQDRLLVAESEKKDLRKQLDDSKTNYAKVVKRLQKSIQETGDNHQEYLAKITAVVENVNDARKEEVLKFTKEIKRLEQERDVKTQQLERALLKLKSEKMKRRKDSGGALPEDAHRLARKLERYFSSEYLLSVIEQARDRPDLSVSVVETMVSSKCRRTLYKLEDAMAVNSASCDKVHAEEVHGSPVDAESICLQNQLVKAYEKIEELTLEIVLMRQGRQP